MRNRPSSHPKEEEHYAQQASLSTYPGGIYQVCNPLRYPGGIYQVCNTLRYP